MLDKIEQFISFLFRIAKWAIMLVFIIFVVILFRSCSQTMDILDEVKKTTATEKSIKINTESPKANVIKEDACKIESWNYKQFTADSIKVDGVTTCMSGKLIIKLYDNNENYIGNKTTYIKGGAFNTYVDGTAPSELHIKYTIY